MTLTKHDDLTVEVDEHTFVATVEIHRPPHNYFDSVLVESLAAIYEELDNENSCRAIVLAAEGRHFCAGARLGGGIVHPADEAERLYDAATRLLGTRKPVVAAVQGAAVGGGLGLACTADFRVAARTSRFVANFAKIGLHHGFGLTTTLPGIVGEQQALRMLYGCGDANGERAAAIGLADRLVDEPELRAAAAALATEIAAAAPLAIEAIRATMRGGIAERVRSAVEHERAEQGRLRITADYAEGIGALADRRPPHFTRS